MKQNYSIYGKAKMKKIINVPPLFLDFETNRLLSLIEPRRIKSADRLILNIILN